jgi:Protein of unknown function (DUF3572)
MSRLGKRQAPATLEAAEAIALQGLAFLAEEPARLQRFVTVTGLEPDELRARADTPELLSAVLEHLAGDESLLLVFAAGRGIAPEAIAPAIALLGARAP